MRLLLAFFILSVSLFAGDFRNQFVIKLKKDEQKKILVKYGNFSKLFKFRWTLYKNGGLVIHRSYDKNIAQNVLYLRHQNQSFRQELSPRDKDYVQPYLLVKFSKFDFETDEAEFDVYLSDDKMKVLLRELN